MGTVSTKTSQAHRPAHVTSESSEEDQVLSRLMRKDPVLEQSVKIIMGKLDQANKKLDELRSDLDTCQAQVSKLLDGKGIEDDEATIMERIQILNAKLSECKRRQLIENTLGFPTILRRILEQFSDGKLMDLSLVNKLWNFEARSVLRDRGSLKATIYVEPGCESLVNLASDLRLMRVVPFTGIHIRCPKKIKDTCQAFPSGSFDPTYQAILDRVLWKHLSLEIPFKWEGARDYPPFVLAKKMLKNYSGVLEEFSISGLDNKNIEFIETLIQGKSFQCLKTFKLIDCGSDALPSGFAKALVSSAPNLETLCIIGGPVQIMENILEGSSAALVVDDFFPLCNQFCESLASALRAERIIVQAFGDFDMELLDGFVPRGIEASRTTLKTLMMDFVFALPLMCYGICLENVSDLYITMNVATLESIQPQMLSIVKAFDFTRVFPKLNQVKISDSTDQQFSLDHISAFVERGNVAAREALPDRAINIRHMELAYLNNFLAPLILSAQMFPHVTKLSVLTRRLREFPFTLLWEHFGGLTELHVEFQEERSSRATNLDSAFCGIFPEEVAELRAKDNRYLQAVNIVPVMPSITCMRDLRSITILDSSRHCDDTNSRDSSRVFSQVTSFVGFSRHPALSVKFEATPGPPLCTIM